MDGKSVYRTDRALLVRMAVIDPDTEAPVFTGDDLPALRALPTGAVNPVAKAALRLCGVGGDDAGN